MSSEKNNIYFGLREHLQTENFLMKSEGAAASSGSSTLRCVSVAALAMSLVPGAAFAEEKPANPEKPKKDEEATVMPEVVVQGWADSYKPETVESPKYTEPLRDTPQTINVVPEKLIEEQAATTLRDVLRNVPGITVQAGEGGVPAGDNFSIRGFNSRTDIFVDGVRDIGGYTRDPFNYEQVEVVKGPASTYTGRGSTGGSVNLATKSPKLEARYGGTAGIGTENYRRFTLDVNQPFEGFIVPGTAFRLNALWHESETAGRDEIEGRRWAVAPSIAFGLGTPTSLIFSYLHMDQDNVPDYGIPWVTPTNIPLAKHHDKASPVSFDNWYGLVNRDYEKTITDMGTAELNHEFNETVSLRFLSRYGRTSRDSIITAPRYNSDDTTEIRRDFKSRDQIDTIQTNQLDLTWEFETFGMQHTMVTGVEFTQEFSENHNRVGPAAPLADLFNPDPHQQYIGRIERDGAYNESKSLAFAPYIFDTIKINEQFELVGGLRWDYFDLDYDSHAVDGTVTSFDRVDTMLTWRAGAVYKPVEYGSIYVSYGTSFNPSGEGLTLNTDTGPLEPEESRTFEIGTKWDVLDEKLSVTAAVFRTEKTNARSEDIDEVVSLSGEQRVDGFEFGLAGNITKDWAVYGGYTYLDTEVEDSKNPEELGNDLPNTPRHSFSLWTTYELPWNFEIGGGVQFVDSRFNNLSNQREAPSYWLYDAMLAYHVTEDVTVRLNVYNLADEEYIDRIGGGHFVPGAGRSGTVTVEFAF